MNYWTCHGSTNGWGELPTSQTQHVLFDNGCLQQPTDDLTKSSTTTQENCSRIKQFVFPSGNWQLTHSSLTGKFKHFEMFTTYVRRIYPDTGTLMVVYPVMGVAAPYDRLRQTVRHIRVPTYAALLHTRATTYIWVQLRTDSRTTLRSQVPVSTLPYQVRFRLYKQYNNRNQPSDRCLQLNII